MMLGRYRLIELTLLPVIWAGLILGALRANGLFSDSAYSVCGPWGCGPPTNSLLAVHLGWLAAIAPPAIYIAWRLPFSGRTIRRFAYGLMFVGLVGLSSIVAWQWFVWLPGTNESFRPYIWQRCFFALATAIDLPFAQIVLTSIGLCLVGKGSSETVKSIG